MLKSLVRVSLQFVCAALVLFGLVGCAQFYNNADGAKNQGIQYCNQGNYTDAAGAFRSAVKMDPRDYEARYYLGICYEHLQQPHDAIQSYRQGLDTMSATLAGRSDWAMRLKLFDALAGAIARNDDRGVELGALEQHAKSAATVEEKAEDCFVVAKIHNVTGDVDSAIAAYTQAALLDPQVFAYRKEAGMYMLKYQQTQLAKPHLIRAYALNDKDEQVQASLRSIGVEPGPSLKNLNELPGPAIPKGPLPEVDWAKLFKFDKGGNTAPKAPTPPAPPEVPANPKD